MASLLPDLKSSKARLVVDEADTKATLLKTSVQSALIAEKGFRDV